MDSIRFKALQEAISRQPIDVEAPIQQSVRFFRNQCVQL